MQSDLITADRSLERRRKRGDSGGKWSWKPRELETERIWKQRDRRTRDLEAKEMDSGEAEGLEKLESIEKAERERPGNG